MFEITGKQETDYIEGNACKYVAMPITITIHIRIKMHKNDVVSNSFGIVDIVSDNFNMLAIMFQFLLPAFPVQFFQLLNEEKRSFGRTDEEVERVLVKRRVSEDYSTGNIMFYTPLIALQFDLLNVFSNFSVIMDKNLLGHVTFLQTTRLNSPVT